MNIGFQQHWNPIPSPSFEPRRRRFVSRVLRIDNVSTDDAQPDSTVALEPSFRGGPIDFCVSVAERGYVGLEVSLAVWVHANMRKGS